jgi:hypothetical protein
VNFIPMAPAVNSIMRLTVEYPNGFLTTENRAAIETLSEIFEFGILGEHEWDISGITGRRCKVAKVNDGYEFLEYID